MGDSGQFAGAEWPGVQPGRGDGTQEGLGVDRVLVGRREEQQAPGGVGQSADLLPVRPQEHGRLRRKRVEAGQLTLGQHRGQLRGRASVAVRGAQDPYPYAFGKRGAELGLRGAACGVHRSHHTNDVTGELTGK